VSGHQQQISFCAPEEIKLKEPIPAESELSENEKNENQLAVYVKEVWLLQLMVERSRSEFLIPRTFAVMFSSVTDASVATNRELIATAIP